jgi:hypothetical protein
MGHSISKHHLYCCRSSAVFRARMCITNAAEGDIHRATRSRVRRHSDQFRLVHVHGNARREANFITCALHDVLPKSGRSVAHRRSSLLRETDATETVTANLAPNADARHEAGARRLATWRASSTRSRLSLHTTEVTRATSNSMPPWPATSSASTTKSASTPAWAIIPRSSSNAWPMPSKASIESDEDQIPLGVQLGLDGNSPVRECVYGGHAR